MAKKSVNRGNIAVKIPAGFGLSVNTHPGPLQRRGSYCRVVNEAVFQSPLLWRGFERGELSYIQ
jgi:hypothetical protein